MPTINRTLAALELNPADACAPTQAEIISALSFALDLTEGAVPGHALRCCLLGMRLGRELGFSDYDLADLYHALLLKDVGCSSNAARMCQIIGGGDDRAVKSGVKLEDWTKPHKPSLNALRLLWANVAPSSGPLSKAARILRIALTQHGNNEEMIQLRCDRGAGIVRKIGMNEHVAQAVRSLDEHWDGGGYPERRMGRAISPLARVMAVAQHLDVFALERGPAQAMLVLRERSERWFDPQVVKAAESLESRGALWMQCLPNAKNALQADLFTRSAVLDLAPAQAARTCAADIDLICEAFAEVVDAKSHFTFRHSVGVTDVASAIGRAMGLKPERKQLLHRAALLHDLGKLRVPNSILDKPGRLDHAEWAVVREHPALSQAILSRVKQFRELAYVAGAHHEKLDGTGYPNGLEAGDLPLEARILAVADVYGALIEDRPYRAGFAPEDALRMVAESVPNKLDADCFEALVSAASSLRTPTAISSVRGSEEIPASASGVFEPVHP
jgi:putative nucleotidyltransferase with HDIG domain